jgi:hypothetical protein
MTAYVNNVFLEKGKVVYETGTISNDIAFNIIPYEKQIMNGIDFPSGSQER